VAPDTFTLVEHLCYKCQSSIDESLPFCPHCGAPQIRVTTPEDENTMPVASSDANLQQPAASAWIPGTPTYQPSAIQWELAWKGALLAGLIAAVLSATPLVGLGCFLWLLGAGALAVWLYQRRVSSAVITTGMGMRLGALTGAFAYAACALWSAYQLARDSQKFRGALMEQMNKQIAASPDPKAQEILRQFMNNLNTPAGLATFFVLIMFFMAIVFIVFSTAGGALGASLFRRRDLR